jgi:transcription-repair coupling factor (superfamily II helicase)
MTDLSRILSARTALTLSGVPAGFLPLLMSDLARAAAGGNAPARAVFVAADELEMQAVADAAGWFAPELDVITIPAWDCLPYDRASPSLRSAAQRLAGLHALQAPVKGPQLVLTTAAAITQKTLTPFRVRQLVARLAPGERIAIDRLTALLQSNGYSRTDTVHDAGEYAVRGGIVDLYPGGAKEPLRLDFFGDEIETLRSFDPATQRSTGPMCRASPCFRRPKRCSTRRRSSASARRYRELFGATATGDPLYQAVSDGDDSREWSTGCPCSRNGS